MLAALRSNMPTTLPVIKADDPVGLDLPDSTAYGCSGQIHSGAGGPQRPRHRHVLWTFRQHDTAPAMLVVMQHFDDAGFAGLSTTRRLVRNVGRIALGAFLAFAGTGHLTFARESFQGQVPDWMPLDKDVVVVASGVVEIVLGLALILAWRWRVTVGWVVAAFFVAVFPGNISQLVTHNDSFGLDTDLKRWLRLPFQPVLIVWALWSTGAWRSRR